MINKARAAVHNGVIVQQLDVARLQLHVHSQLIKSSQAIELCNGCQLRLCEPWHFLMPLTHLIVAISKEAAKMTLGNTHTQTVGIKCSRISALQASVSCKLAA